MVQHIIDLFMTQLRPFRPQLVSRWPTVPFPLVLLSWVTAFLGLSLLLQRVCVIAAPLSAANNPEIWLQGLLTNKRALQVASKYLLSRVAFPTRLVSVSAATFPTCLRLHWKNLLIELQWVSDGLQAEHAEGISVGSLLLPATLHSVAEVSISADVFAASRGCSGQWISKSVIHFWLRNASD